MIRPRLGHLERDILALLPRLRPEDTHAGELADRLTDARIAAARRDRTPQSISTFLTPARVRTAIDRLITKGLVRRRDHHVPAPRGRHAFYALTGAGVETLMEISE